MFYIENDDEINDNNVYKLSLVLPVIEILEAFFSRKNDLSSDEFCLVLFTSNTINEKDCKSYSNSMKYLIEDVKNIQVPLESLHYEIAEMFMTVVRFEIPLKSLCEDFIERRRFYKKEEDLCEIMVLIYLLIFQISSLVIQNSMNFFTHFKIDKILNLVSYMLRNETLNLLYKKSIDIFDESFVKEKICEPYLLALPRLKALRIYLNEERKRTRMLYKPNTTKPIFMKVLNRVKKIPKVPPPTPEDLDVRISPRKVPRSTYCSPSIEEKLNDLREANKIQALRLLKEANECAPSCILKRETNCKLFEIEKDVRHHVYAKKKRLPIYKPVEVKQNATSILRECARIAGEELKEISKIRKLVEGNLDSVPVMKLNEKIKRENKVEEIKKMEEKRLIAMLTRKGASLAKRSRINDNKMYAQNVREETKKLYERLKQLRIEYKMVALENVEKCKEFERASRDAHFSMIDEKRRKAAEVSEESRQLKIILARRKEKEMQKKCQLIKEIKTIQSLTLSTKNKEFDPTERSGLGLLCEMSLAELKERLVLVKMNLNKELEKRQIIVQKERERQKNIIKYSKIALEKYKSNKIDQRKRDNDKLSNLVTA